MANASQTRAANAGLMLDLSAVIYHAFQRLADFRAYRKTVIELSRLSNAELADLGLTRTTIRDAARRAVYGA